jgi:CBS domain-containing protein
MSTKVEPVRPDESLAGAERRMRRRGIHHLVVVKRHKVGDWGRITKFRVIIPGSHPLSQVCDRAEDAFSIGREWRREMTNDGWRQVIPVSF